MRLGGVISISLQFDSFWKICPWDCVSVSCKATFGYMFLVGLKVSGVCSLFVSSDIGVVPSMKKL